jgi:two-component system cell cycle sensor histidine kinase/response regulator CckA
MFLSGGINRPTLTRLSKYASMAYLALHGFRVLAASDGQAALRQSREHERQIDVVVTDYRMPKMDGVELANALWRERPGVPIVFVSATDTDELLKRVPEALLLPKTADLTRILQTITHLLSGRPDAGC